MMRRSVVVVAIVASMLGACSRPSPPSGEANAAVRAAPLAPAATGSDVDRRANEPPDCLDVVVTSNSPSTQKLFDAKECQGGGVTWAAIIEALLKRRGSSKPVDMDPPRWTGDVRAMSWKGKAVRVALDEEGDAARSCTDSAALLSEIRADVARLNANPAELERAMKEADPAALECEALSSRHR